MTEFEFELLKSAKGISWQLRCLNENLERFNTAKQEFLNTNAVLKPDDPFYSNLMDKLKRKRDIDDSED